MKSILTLIALLLVPLAALHAADCATGVETQYRLYPLRRPRLWRRALPEPAARQDRHASHRPAGGARNELYRSALQFGSLHTDPVRHPHRPLQLVVAAAVRRVGGLQSAADRCRQAHRAGLAEAARLRDGLHRQVASRDGDCQEASDSPIGDGPTTRGFDYYFGISASLDMPPFAFIENNRFTETPTVQKTLVRAGIAAPSFEAVDVLPTLTRKAVALHRPSARSPVPRSCLSALELAAHADCPGQRMAGQEWPRQVRRLRHGNRLGTRRSARRARQRRHR